MVVVDWFEDSDSFLVNSSLVVESLETSGKETPKLLRQVMQATAGIKTLSHHGSPKHNNANWTNLSFDLFRAFCQQTSVCCILLCTSTLCQNSVLFSEALVFND